MLSLALLTLGTATPRGALAQERAEEIGVVLATDEEHDVEALRAVAEEVDQELAVRGVAHLSTEQARAAFEQRHSREPASPEALDLLRLPDRVERAIDALSAGHLEQALAGLEETLGRGDEILERVNRDPKAAAALFHACLLAVQIHAEQGDDSGAQKQAERCLIRSPGMVLPSENRSYQPAVRAHLSSAEAALKQSPATTLAVRSTPHGCSVSMNGKAVGTTPHAQQVVRGVPQRVQVDCAGGRKPGRVHLVVPVAEVEEVEVDTAFESAVHTEGAALRLDHAARALSDDLVRKQLRLLQQLLDARFVVIVTRPQRGRFALVRFGSGGLATVQLADGHDAKDVAHALDQLLAPVLADERDVPQVEPVASDPSVPRAERRTLTRALAATTVTAGLALTGVGLWRHGVQRDRARAYVRTDPSDGPYYARGRAWYDERPRSYALVAAGTALSTTGALWLLLAQDRSRPLPWWATALSGTVGGALLVVGAAEVARGSACEADGHADTRTCARDLDRRDLGALLMLSATPAIGAFAVGLSQRDARRPTPTLSFRPEIGGASLTVQQAL